MENDEMKDDQIDNNVLIGIRQGVGLRALDK